jgi:hypothetical protein
MNDFYRAKSYIRNIRTRTWIILGGVVVAIIGLFIWLAVSLISLFWNQITTGEGLAGNALAQADQYFPGWREHAQQWAPALTGEALTLYEHAKRVAPELTQSAEKMIPDMPIPVSTLPDANPLTDVSGVDIGPVTRFPGLVRTAFLRNGETVQVDYQGKAAINEVVAYYTKEFEVDGFAHEVMQATTSSELHKFTQQGTTITLLVERLKSGSLMVQLTSSQ